MQSDKEIHFFSSFFFLGRSERQACIDDDANNFDDEKMIEREI